MSGEYFDERGGIYDDMEKIKILDIYKIKVTKKVSKYRAVIDKMAQNKTAGNGVTLSDGEVVFLSDNEIFKYDIHKGDEFNYEDWGELISNVETDRAYSKGLDILMFKKNSKKELQDKLLNRTFSPEAVKTALLKLEDAGYIDDRKYAESYFKSLAGDKYKTKYQIERELLRKGIDNDIISELLSGYGDDDGNDDFEKIKQFINNKYNKLISDGNIEYNKLVNIERTLYNKGYNPEYIDRVIDDIFGRKDINSD